MLSFARFRAKTHSVLINSLFRFSSKDNSKKFNSLPLNEKIKSGLRSQNILEMTEIQSACLPDLLAQNLSKAASSLITAETGSGKTLCYALPAMNYILETKAKLSEAKEQGVKENGPRGALILTATKELCAQIYSVIRKIDSSKEINVSRTGSIAYVAPITLIRLSAVGYRKVLVLILFSFHFSPCVDHVQSENEEDKGKHPALSEEKMRYLSMENVVNGVNWSKLDILVTTPGQMNVIYNYKDKRDPYEINPKYIVIDEADLLLGDTNLARTTKSIIARYLGKKGATEEGRQIILCGATLPKKIDGGETELVLKSLLKQYNRYKSNSFHRLSDKLEHQIVDVDQYLKENPDSTALNLLFSIVKKSTSQSIIIFCQGTQTVQTINKGLSDEGITSGEYFAQMSTESRIEVLNRFHSRDIRVLVTTDLASRGLDFKNVDHVIQYNFAKNAISLLHRFGRTARMGRAGLVTSFKRQEDDFFVGKVNEVLQSHSTLESIFSRKRSLRKKTRTSTASDENDDQDEGYESDEL